MFWYARPTTPPPDPNITIPAGANGTMVIVSAGSDKKLQSLATDKSQVQTTAPNSYDSITSSKFDPENGNITKPDLYFNFNAGIQ